MLARRQVPWLLPFFFSISICASSFAQVTRPPAPPATAIRLPAKKAACNVDYPDEDKGSKSLKWDTARYTYCGYEATEVSRTDHASWWWSAKQNGIITISYECQSGTIVDKWGSWTEVDFTALVVPGQQSESQLREIGCLVPEFADACVCTKDNPQKVTDCYTSGGNCLFDITTIGSRCTVDTAECRDSDFTKMCDGLRGTLLLIPDSPFCRV